MLMIKVDTINDGRVHMEWLFDPDRIKIGRDSRDVSQAELAQRMGLSTQQVSAWESGKVEPGMSSLCRICNALQLPPRFFFVQGVPNVHGGDSEQAA